MKPALTAIINTPEFQRLRSLKQMGLVSFVYPGATHTRFEHSLGVCHLAGQLLKAIMNNQPELDVSDKDMLCVEIAGLCHDLGHGPFSHLFDKDFIPRVSKNNANRGVYNNWSHEKGSIKIFDLLIKNNGLMEEGGALWKEGLDEKDMTFIKEQIYGPEDTEKGYTGRSEEKMFLYEIVANKRNNIDVDKWDYLARDCFYIGFNNGFSEKRLMKYARVLRDGNTWQICVRDKVVNDLYEMFTIRYKIFNRVIYHRVNKAFDLMVVDALLAANGHLSLLWNDESMDVKSISECITDMATYTRLDDSIMNQILNCRHKELEKSRNIIQNMMSRNLYKMVAETEAFDPDRNPERNYERKMIKDEMKVILESASQEVGRILETFEVDICRYDFGMGRDNPLSNLKVYTKNDPDQAVPAPVPMLMMVPAVFRECCIRVFCRSLTYETEITTAFQQWWQHEKLELQ